MFKFTTSNFLSSYSMYFLKVVIFFAFFDKASYKKGFKSKVKVMLEFIYQKTLLIK
jgi:hypothetical protein